MSTPSGRLSACCTPATWKGRYSRPSGQGTSRALDVGASALEAATAARSAWPEAVHCTWLTCLSPRTHSTRSPACTSRPQVLHALSYFAVITIGLAAAFIVEKLYYRVSNRSRVSRKVFLHTLTYILE